ncbi:MAG: undecaprenyldiphospho-muramoylpentapeptide beta-N-acetylglucosaminyltransferase [Thalassobius sp.]|nr:undecaprenyldiphospho-muramoylpentapeptide beta-N-acetylglucosaminyltransferase [Thalassovita sp.]
MTNKGEHIKVIISGGGTGGHIYPAIAIADALKDMDSETEILFVGAEGKMEMEKVPQAGYNIKALPVSGLQRKLTLKNLSVPFKLLKSLNEAGRIINGFQPDVVVGVGGYASAPVLRKAQNKKIPTLIQEQNGYAGLTNKMLSSKAAKICVAYPGMEQYFPKNKIMFLGNPVRKDIGSLDKLKAEAFEYFNLDPEKPVVLSIGGSLGARTINEGLLSIYKNLLDRGIQLIWQTGKFYYESIKQQLDSEAKGLWVNAFISRMDLAYACADMVVSRAGALSISELCLAGKPAILIPSPNVAEDHQTKNAMALVKEDAAVMLSDSETKLKLQDEIIDLVENEDKKNQMIQNIKKLAKPHAAMDIAKEIVKLTSDKMKMA